MICISCGNTSFQLYSQDSAMNLPVYQCNFCKLYFNGNKKKISGNLLGGLLG